ncbi:MAG: hypothetical protein ACM65L_19720 [Microcoleus sp.]
MQSRTRHQRGASPLAEGSCTGYRGYKPLVDFTKNHRTPIKLFNLPSDIRFPSDSTFRNIIPLDFEAIAVLFNVWSPLPQAPGNWAIDGKSIKSTLVGGQSSYQNFVSMVSVYSHARAG